MWISFDFDSASFRVGRVGKDRSGIGIQRTGSTFPTARERTWRVPCGMRQSLSCVGHSKLQLATFLLLTCCLLKSASIRPRRYSKSFVCVFVQSIFSCVPSLLVYDSHFDFSARYLWNVRGNTRYPQTATRVFSEARRLPFPSVFGRWYGILSIYLSIASGMFGSRTHPMTHSS